MASKFAGTIRKEEKEGGDRVGHPGLRAQNIPGGRSTVAVRKTTSLVDRKSAFPTQVFKARRPGFQKPAIQRGERKP